MTDHRATVAEYLQDLAAKTADRKLLAAAAYILAEPSPGRPPCDDGDVLHRIEVLIARGVPRSTAIASVARAVGANDSTVHRWRRKMRMQIVGRNGF